MVRLNSKFVGNGESSNYENMLLNGNLMIIKSADLTS